ncbi:hypothetical protein XcodCFBP4690_07865 [Xanthomonas codiaei]|uniref:Uncharacterized protein n=1 Tax=Xanthomonas codiaei TaxID=56463 RepID=A0A2S7CTB7_9XANT|nr:hypothetical protein XcodCFBP4690_07865 [Xanthomonas codiaei]
MAQTDDRHGPVLRLRDACASVRMRRFAHGISRRCRLIAGRMRAVQPSAPQSRVCASQQAVR